MAFRSISTAASDTGVAASTSITVAKPVGVQTGDILIAYIGCASDPGTITWPLGFTQLTGFVVNQSGTNSLYAAWKKATASEPANYIINSSVVMFPVAGIAAFYNISNVAPIAYSTTTQAASLVGPTATFGSGGAAAISGFNSPGPVDICLIETKFFGYNVPATFSAPPGFVQIDSGTNVLTTPYTTIGLATSNAYVGNSSAISNGTITIVGSGFGYGVIAVRLPIYATRATNTGSFLTNMVLDEVTNQGSSTPESTRTTGYYVGGNFDEVTGMISNDSSLLLNLDSTINSAYFDTNNVWHDAGNNSYNFSIVGGASKPVFTQGTPAYYTFTATTYQVMIANSNFADQLPNMTAAAWIRTSRVVSTQYPPIVCKMRNQSNGSGWVFQLYWDNVSDNRLAFLIQDGINSYGNLAVSTKTTDGQWHYVAATLSGGYNGAIKLYQDGVLITNTSGSIINGPGPVSSWSTTTNISVGSDIVGGFGRWQGDIAEVEIYNRVLSDAEIANNFSAHAARYSINPLSTVPTKRITTSTASISGIYDEVTGIF